MGVEAVGGWEEGEVAYLAVRLVPGRGGARVGNVAAKPGAELNSCTGEQALPCVERWRRKSCRNGHC